MSFKCLFGIALRVLGVAFLVVVPGLFAGGLWRSALVLLVLGPSLYQLGRLLQQSLKPRLSWEEAPRRSHHHHGVYHHGQSA